MSNGEFAGGSGVTRVTSLPTPSEGLRGKIFYLSVLDGVYRPGYYVMSEDSLEWQASGVGQGKVWVADVSPTPGQTSKNVGVDDDGSTSGTVVFEATGNTDLIRITVRAIGETSYKPGATVRLYDNLGVLIPGQEYTVPFTAPDQGGPEWEGYVDADAGAFSGAPYDVTIEVEHDDGARFSTEYHVVFGPVITAITFVSANEALGSGHTNKYPQTSWSAQQSEVKSGDSIYFRVDCDPAAPAMTGIYVYGQAGDLRTTTINDIAIASGHTGYFTTTVTNTGTSATLRGLKIKAHKLDGVFGEDFTSTDTLLHNNVTPTSSIGSVSYPVGQTALKEAEVASFFVTYTNADDVRIPEALPVGDSIIVDTTPLSAGGTATIHRNNLSSVGTLESGSNYSVKCFRSANGRESFNVTKLVWIQNDFPNAQVIEPQVRLRSGGNDGTSIQTHTITLSSVSQNITESPTLDLGHVPVTGGWASSTSFSGSGTSWSNSLRVHDNDPKGSFTWGSFSITNRALRTTTVITGNTSYVLGGFVERILSIDPSSPEGVRKSQVQFGTLVLDPSAAKLVCFNGGELGNWDYSSSDTDQNDKFTILAGLDGAVATAGLGNVWASLDANYHDNRTQPYTIRLEELV